MCWFRLLLCEILYDKQVPSCLSCSMDNYRQACWRAMFGTLFLNISWSPLCSQCSAFIVDSSKSPGGSVSEREHRLLLLGRISMANNQTSNSALKILCRYARVRPHVQGRTSRSLRSFFRPLDIWASSVLVYTIPCKFV